MFSIFSLPGFALPRPLEAVDIGARIEGAPRWSPLAPHEAVRVTAFEPQAEDRRKLEASGWPVRCLPHFLGDGREATFHVTRWPGNCSLFRPDSAAVDAFTGLGASHPTGNFHVVSTARVQTTRLDDVADLPRPDFIKLDIQGAELMVLQNGRMALSRALVVESEALFVPLYHEQPLFGELHAFMRGEGFLFHRFMNVAGRCYRPFATNDPAVPISQPLWADAVFVRNPLALEGWPTADLLAGAALLHEMYGSYDLVLRLLAEHDRRSSTSFGSEYVAALQRLGSVASCFLSLENVPT